MKQNIRNVAVTFGLVAITAYVGNVIYTKQLAEEILLARNIEAVQLQTEDQLQLIIDERKKKLETEALVAELAEAKRQAEAEAIAQSKKSAEAEAITKALNDKDEQSAIAAEAKLQADILADQKRTELIAIQQKAAAETVRLAELAAAEAAAKKSARRSRAS